MTRISRDKLAARAALADTRTPATVAQDGAAEKVGAAMTTTKTEWYSRGTAGSDAHGQHAIYDATGQDIAIVYDGKAHGELVAAAPDLLAALKHVLDAAEDGGDFYDVDWRKLRAAIARAEGGAA